MGARKISEPLCGSRDIAHRRRSCKPCLAAYARAFRAKRHSPDDVRCAICSLARRRGGTPVYMYPITRMVAGRRRCIASIGLCDRCIQEKGMPSPSYVKANRLLERSWTSPKVAA
jgi:hypothetical protein